MTRIHAVMIILVIGACAALGWRALPTGNDPAAEKETATEPAAAPRFKKMPDAPGLEEKVTASEVLVKVDNPSAERKKDDGYRQDEKCAVGELRGICIVRHGGAKSPPVDINVDIPKDVKDVTDKEREYYKQLKLQQPNFLAGPEKDGSYRVWGAIVALRGIKVGRQPPLEQNGIAAFRGKLDVINGENRFGGACISPIGERVLFLTWDPYPSNIVLNDPDGKELYNGWMGPYDATPTGTVDWGSDGKGGTCVGTLYKKPAMIASTPVKKMGVCTVSCKRHPWQRGYVFIADNPYVTALRNPSDFWGATIFSLKDIPPGTHELEVWHPELEPVKKTISVEIKENQVTEIEIEFKAPAQTK